MGRNFKYKQIDVLKAIESVKAGLPIRKAVKRFSVSKQAIEYALKKKEQTHKELEKIQSIPDEKRNTFEIKKLTRLFHLSLEILQEKLSKARPKDLMIIASIIFDKRNLMLTKSIKGDGKIDFPVMSKKTKILIEQFIYDNKSSKDIKPRDIIDSEPINRTKTDSKNK